MGKRKIWLFVLMLAILVTAISFAGGRREAEPARLDVGGPVGEWADAVRANTRGARITALLAAHPSTSAILTMIDDFTAKTGIRVDTRILASVEIRTVQRTNSSARTGIFDVYMVDAFTIYEFGRAGFLENLTPRLNDRTQTPAWFDWDDVLPAFRDGISTVAGQVFTIPVAGESRFIAYRRDLFARHNRQVPRTLDELLETAHFFNGREPGLHGISFRGMAGTQAGSAHMSLAYCFTDSPIICQRTGQPTINSPESIQSIQFMLDLARAAPPDIVSFNHEDALASFAQGRVAMWFDATALAQNMEDTAIPVVRNNVGYFTVPDGPAGGSGAIAGWGLGIPACSRNRDAAWAFIMYMTSREMALVYNLAGGVPNRISTFNDPQILASFPSNRYIFDAIMAAGDLTRRGITYNYPSVHVLNFMGIIGNQINRAMTGAITATEAANNAQREMESVLADS